MTLTTACAVVALAAGALAPSRPQDALAVVAGAAVMAAVLLQPLVGALLLVVVVPITSGFAAGFPVAHVRMSEATIGLVGVSLIAFVRRRDVVPWGTLDWTLLAYGLSWAAFGIFADITLHQHLSIEEWGTVVGQLQFFLIYRGVRIAVRTAGERRIAVGALVLASLPVSVLAILQEIKTPGTARLITKLTGGVTGGSAATGVSSVHRATGPFVNWAALAGYLLPVVLVLVALALARTEVRGRRWFIATAVLGAVALALTIEQSAIVCVLVGVLVLVRRYDKDGGLKRLTLVGIVLVIVAVSPFLVSRFMHELGTGAGTGHIGWVPETLSFRWSVWTKQYLPAIGARPLTGYGVVLPTSIRWAWPESQYVSFLVEGGVPMLVMFGALTWAMIDGARAAARSLDPFEQALGRALLLTVISMVVVNAVWPFLSNGGMPQALWGLMALTVPGLLRSTSPVEDAWVGPRREVPGTSRLVPGVG